MERLPPQNVVEEQLLGLLRTRQGAVRTNAIYEMLADQFRLTRSERYGHPFDPKGSHWQFLIRLARKALQERGLLQNSQPGHWELTGEGRRIAMQDTNHGLDA